jgi:hypothetical protein
VAPFRVSRAHVIEQQAVGSRYFALQYKLQANVRETNRYPLRLNDLIVLDCGHRKGPTEILWGEKDHDGQSTAIQDMEIYGFSGDCLRRPCRYSAPEECVQYQVRAGAVDPGGSSTKKTTAWCMGASLNGRVFLHELDSGSRGAVNIPRIADALFRNRCTRCYVEGNLGASTDLESNSFASTLQIACNKMARPIGDQEVPEGWGCHIEVTRSSGRKELRIIGSLETPLTGHRVVASRQVAGNHEFQYQLSHITSQVGCVEKLDELDVVAQLIDALNPTFVIDPVNAHKSEMERQIDEAIAKRRGMRSDRSGRMFTFRC